MAQTRCKLGTKCKCWNVPTIISAWDSDLVSNRILQTQHVWKIKVATQIDEITLRDSREWTTIASSKTWAGSATHMWTSCPRQAWPRSSLIIKHYRVQVENHRRGYQSPCIRHALKKELLLLEQVIQWLGVLGNTYRMQAANLSNHRALRTCMTNLGWFQRKQKQSFSYSRRQLA